MRKYARGFWLSGVLGFSVISIASAQGSQVEDGAHRLLEAFEEVCLGHLPEFKGSIDEAKNAYGLSEGLRDDGFIYLGNGGWLDVVIRPGDKCRVNSFGVEIPSDVESQIVEMLEDYSIEQKREPKVFGDPGDTSHMVLGKSEMDGREVQWFLKSSSLGPNIHLEMTVENLLGL